MALITYLTTIRFDHGALSGLPDDLAACGITRPLLVTDKGVIAAGIAANVLALLPAGTPVYDGTPPNPTEEAVDEALTVYRAGNCDGVVALGGGSAIDLAKGVALLATHVGPLRQYALIEGGATKIKPQIAPLIAIPTTSGTGSEVGRGTVLSFRDGRKMSVIGPAMLPRRAICDPDLTLGLPPMLTAATGMDALTHCIECYSSRIENPPAGAIAFDGGVRVARHIERATANGQDREARYQMMMGSMMGAMAFQKGLGAVHALSHALGGLKEISLHHGTLNAVLLPAVIRFNRDHVGEAYHTLALAFGAQKDGLDIWVADLNRRLGLPARLGEMGVKREWFERVAAHAMEDHTTQTTPRKPTAGDYVNLLEESF